MVYVCVSACSPMFSSDIGEPILCEGQLQILEKRINSHSTLEASAYSPSPPFSLLLIRLTFFFLHAFIPHLHENA